MTDEKSVVQASVPAPRFSEELRASAGYWEMIRRKVEEMGEPSDATAALIAALIREYQEGE